MELMWDNTSVHLRLLTFLFFFALKAKASVVITDVDDTLRKTESLVPEYAVAQYLMSPNDYFIGMKNLLDDLKLSSLGSQIFYVTDNYREVYDTTDWLNSNNFPQGEVYQRENVASVLINKKDNHKQDRIKLIARSHLDSSGPFFFIGDNGYEDPKIYQQIAELFKDHNSKILIRDIKGETIFVGMLNQPTQIKAPLYVFSGEYEFWFDLKYDFLVRETSLKSWISWYADWLKRTAIPRSTSTYLARKIIPAYCKGERKGVCANLMQNQIDRSIAIRYRPLF